MLVGVGKPDKADVHAYREAGATVVASCKKVHGDELTVVFHDADLACMASFAEGMMKSFRDYNYDLYKKKDEDDEDITLSAQSTATKATRRRSLRPLTGPLPS